MLQISEEIAKKKKKRIWKESKIIKLENKIGWRKVENKIDYTLDL